MIFFFPYLPAVVDQMEFETQQQVSIGVLPVKMFLAILENQKVGGVVLDVEGKSRRSSLSVQTNPVQTHGRANLLFTTLC